MKCVDGRRRNVSLSLSSLRYLWNVEFVSFRLFEAVGLLPPKQQHQVKEVDEKTTTTLPHLHWNVVVPFIEEVGFLFLLLLFLFF